MLPLRRYVGRPDRPSPPLPCCLASVVPGAAAGCCRGEVVLRRHVPSGGAWPALSSGSRAPPTFPLDNLAANRTFDTCRCIPQYLIKPIVH